MGLESPRSSPGSPRSPPGPPRSPPGSPRSPPGSPRSPAGSPRSSPGPPRSPAGSPRSPAGSPRSPAGSPRSPAGSPRSSPGPPRSPAGSPRSPAGSPRSSPGPPRSPAGSPRSPAGSPRSSPGPPRSPAGSPRSPPGSPRSPLLLLLPLLLLCPPAGAAGVPRVPRPLSLRVRGWAPSPGVSYSTHYLEQKIDHFGFAEDGSFKQRYLQSALHHRAGGPVLFYTGNEGDITWFCNNTGFMWDVAEELGALLVFAEHRYYGESLPFGDKAYSSPQTLQYLSSAQALADFAVLIEHIRGTVPGVGDSPVVAVGGSYGGMLAAWLRMKYPQSVVGALAASAPIWQFTGLTECGAYARIVTRTFETRGGAACPRSVRRSWAAIDRVASTVDGLRWLSATFRLCAPLGGPGAVLALKAWLAETWGDLAMVDYPYAASFLQPLPAFPVHAVCSHLQKPDAPDAALLQAVVRAASVYYNHTGSSACFNTSQSATASLGMQGWDYQACTEMVMPACADGKVDMFEEARWDLAAFAEECRRTWGVLPRPTWATTLYGGRNITQHTNIVFSNGGLDPWSGGGVTRSLSLSLPALLIPDGAHHADLRSNCAQDPDSFLHARRAEVALIQQWVKEARDRRQP